jgi:hypothetical protein
MTSQIDGQSPVSPSLSTLAKTTAIALVVAGVILVTIVLPAEYGIDPVGTGRWLGLTAIAAPESVAAPEVDLDLGLLVPVQKGPIGEYHETYKTNVFDVTLQPRGSVEYKYYLEQGATMLYSWTASAPVNHDFHGEQSMGLGSGTPAVQREFHRAVCRHSRVVLGERRHRADLDPSDELRVLRMGCGDGLGRQPEHARPQYSVNIR